ncbi:MAG: endo-1,4-beta-xylanase [Alistipes sp.]|nr:endo-1,4-beta-xylanase [Alistipes sp.]
MKRIICASTLLLALLSTTANAQPSFPRSAKEDASGFMSQAYWAMWNEEEQARIDKDIEKYRKADGELTLTNIARNSEVKIEQISHKFIFGAHIFNYNQLGKSEYNERYRELYGTLFNSATIAFYWRTFETEPGRMRFATEYWDTEEYWNNCPNPYDQPHWRRPSTDQLVEFCKEKGIRAHGHVLIWGSRRWHQPEWLQNLMTPSERETFKRLFPNEPNRFRDEDAMSEEYKQLSHDQVAECFKEYLDTLNRVFDNRIRIIAERYKSNLQSWDVVNESAADYESGGLIENHTVSKTRYGLMPGDMDYKALMSAKKYFPEEVKLNINDYHLNQSYNNQISRLLERGCKIDIAGMQMHLFNPKQCVDIANGAQIQTPSQVRSTIGRLCTLGLPLHLSEITITSPSNDEKGFMIQAIIAQNLYRLWFSMENMMGITWWNVVDNCGAKGEPSTSGLFTRDMQAKPVYYALNNLINNEWKTSLTTKADKNGLVQFRGFKGTYRITWTDKKGREQTMEYNLE